MNARMLLLCFLCACGAPSAAASAAEGEAGKRASPPRFALRAAQFERSAADGGRYAIRARFAREEPAGELREAGDFTLIGRLAPKAAACGSDTIFRHGFEGN